ncbi:MAG TPA: DUF3822 family protein [Taishania sp.]|nr:DUF3822 family protein [Taishania sp.]
MNNTHLSIDINLSAVKFTKLSGAIVIKEEIFTFVEKQDYRYKQQLEEFWQQSGFKENEFDEVTLSWSDYQTTLVPVNLFNESSKDDLFRLSYGEPISSDLIDYNRLPMQGIVNVYSIPLWVKSFFVIRFPRIIIQHEGSHLVRGIFNGSTFSLNAMIVVHEQHFLVAICHENKLKYYSSFTFNALEDIVYYYSFTCQQLELMGGDHNLTLCNGVASSIDLAVLESLLEKVFQSKIHIKIDNYLLDKYQQLCV